MTTDEQVSAIYTMWGEDANNSVVSPAQIMIFINRAARRLCLTGQILLTCETADTVVGQEVYQVPGNHLKVEFINIIDRIVPGGPGLIPMNANDRDPTSREGLPTNYYIWGGESASTGLNVMAVGMQPVPNAIETYDIYLRKSPTKQVHSTEGAMVNSDLKEIWQDACNDFALMSIYQRLGPDFYGLYQGMAAQWKNWETEAKNFINPLHNDRLIARRDTMGYAYEYGD
jgi:hypothetical protein